MRITFIAIGTRGDVQPTIALARSLASLGYQVTMVASVHFQTWIESYGLRVVPSSLDFHAIMTGELGHRWVENSEDISNYILQTKDVFAEIGLQMMQDALAGCQDAQVVVSNHLAQIYAASIAEKVGALHISIHLMPTLMRTQEWFPFSPAFLFGDKHRDPQLDLWLIGPIVWQIIGDISNQFRQSALGLKPESFVENQLKLHKITILQGYSPHVVPIPEDIPANVLTTGFYFLDEDENWHPPARLEKFINEGNAPVFVSFGSMTKANPDGLTKSIVKALKVSGERAILQAGWAGLGNMELPSNVFLLDHTVPFKWLLPKVAAIVQHGGAGTAAESFRAGVPMVVVPHMADQPFWGDRAHALGVAPPPIPLSKLNFHNLSSAIHSVTHDKTLIRRAAELGASWVEFDVMLTGDGRPVLYHDDNLERLTGVNAAESG